MNGDDPRKNKKYIDFWEKNFKQYPVLNKYRDTLLNTDTTWSNQVFSTALNEFKGLNKAHVEGIQAQNKRRFHLDSDPQSLPVAQHIPSLATPYLTRETPPLDPGTDYPGAPGHYIKHSSESILRRPEVVSDPFLEGHVQGDVADITGTMLPGVRDVSGFGAGMPALRHTPAPLPPPERVLPEQLVQQRGLRDQVPGVQFVDPRYDAPRISPTGKWVEGDWVDTRHPVKSFLDTHARGPLHPRVDPLSLPIDFPFPSGGMGTTGHVFTPEQSRTADIAQFLTDKKRLKQGAQAGIFPEIEEQVTVLPEEFGPKPGGAPLDIDPATGFEREIPELTGVQAQMEWDRRMLGNLGKGALDSLAHIIGGAKFALDPDVRRRAEEIIELKDPKDVGSPLIKGGPLRGFFEPAAAKSAADQAYEAGELSGGEAFLYELFLEGALEVGLFGLWKLRRAIPRSVGKAKAGIESFTDIPPDAFADAQTRFKQIIKADQEVRPLSERMGVASVLSRDQAVELVKGGDLSLGSVKNLIMGEDLIPPQLSNTQRDVMSVASPNYNPERAKQIFQRIYGNNAGYFAYKQNSLRNWIGHSSNRIGDGIPDSVAKLFSNTSPDRKRWAYGIDEFEIRRLRDPDGWAEMKSHGLVRHPYFAANDQQGLLPGEFDALIKLYGDTDGWKRAEASYKMTQGRMNTPEMYGVIDEFTDQGRAKDIIRENVSHYPGDPSIVPRRFLDPDTGVVIEPGRVYGENPVILRNIPNSMDSSYYSEEVLKHIKDNPIGVPGKDTAKAYIIILEDGTTPRDGFWRGESINGSVPEVFPIGIQEASGRVSRANELRIHQETRHLADGTVVHYVVSEGRIARGIDSMRKLRDDLLGGRKFEPSRYDDFYDIIDPGRPLKPYSRVWEGKGKESAPLAGKRGAEMINDFLEWFQDLPPHYQDVALSIRRGKGTGGALGDYQPGTAVMNIWKGLFDPNLQPNLWENWKNYRGQRYKAGSPEDIEQARMFGATAAKTLVHEMMHHLESFVPQDVMEQLMKIYVKDFKSPAGEELLRRQGAIKGGGPHYKYENIAEWFAVVMTDAAMRRDFLKVAPEAKGIVDRAQQVIRNFALSIRNFLIRTLRSPGRDVTDADRAFIDSVYEKLVSGEYIAERGLTVRTDLARQQAKALLPQRKPARPETMPYSLDPVQPTSPWTSVTEFDPLSGPRFQPRPMTTPIFDPKLNRMVHPREPGYNKLADEMIQDSGPHILDPLKGQEGSWLPEEYGFERPYQTFKGFEPEQLEGIPWEGGDWTRLSAKAPGGPEAQKIPPTGPGPRQGTDLGPSPTKPIKGDIPAPSTPEEDLINLNPIIKPMQGLISGTIRKVRDKITRYREADKKGIDEMRQWKRIQRSVNANIQNQSNEFITQFKEIAIDRGVFQYTPTGLIRGIGRTLQDVAADRQFYIDNYPETTLEDGTTVGLGPDQIQALAELEELMKPWDDVREFFDLGPDVVGKRGDVQPGGFWLPRGGADFDKDLRLGLSKYDEDVGNYWEILDAPVSHRGKSRSEAGWTKETTFATMKEGMNAGWEYAPIEEAMHAYVRSVGYLMRDKYLGAVAADLRNASGVKYGKTARQILLESSDGEELAASIAKLKEDLTALRSKTDEIDESNYEALEDFVHNPGNTEIDKAVVAASRILDKVRMNADLNELVSGIHALLRDKSQEWNIRIKKIETGAADKGLVKVPGLAGGQHLYFPKAIAKAIEDTLNQEALWHKLTKWEGKTGWERVWSFPFMASEWWNNLFRASGGTMDDSAFGIQGVGLAWSRPHVAFPSLGLGLRSLGSSKVQGAFNRAINEKAQRLLREHGLEANGINENSLIYKNFSSYMTSKGLHVAGMVGEFQFRGVLAKAPGLKQFNRAFGVTGDTMRKNMFLDRLEAELKRGRTIYEIERSGDMEAIALHGNRLTGTGVDRAFNTVGDVLTFAPRFLKARWDTASNAFVGSLKTLTPGQTPTMEQRLAMSDMWRLMWRGTLATLLFNTALNGASYLTDYETGIQNTLTPIKYNKRTGKWIKNPDFLKIMKTGGRGWGRASVFAGFDSLLAMVLSVGAAAFNPKDRSAIADVANATFRPLAGGTARAFWDMGLGTDLYGKRINPWMYDDAQFLEWVGSFVTPFSFWELHEAGSRMIEGYKEDNPAAVVTGAGLTAHAFFGGKWSYYSASRERTTMFQEVAADRGWSTLGEFLESEEGEPFRNIEYFANADPDERIEHMYQLPPSARVKVETELRSNDKYLEIEEEISGQVTHRARFRKDLDEQDDILAKDLWDLSDASHADDSEYHLNLYRRNRSDKYDAHHTKIDEIRSSPDFANISDSFKTLGKFAQAQEMYNRVMYGEEEEYIKAHTGHYEELHEPVVDELNWEEYERREHIMEEKFGKDFIDQIKDVRRSEKFPPLEDGTPHPETLYYKMQDIIDESGYYTAARDVASAIGSEYLSFWLKYLSGTTKEQRDMRQGNTREMYNQINNDAIHRRRLLRSRNEQLEASLRALGYVKSDIREITVPQAPPTQRFTLPKVVIQ